MTTSIQLASILYLLYVALSLALGAIAATTLIWMLHAWRTPDSFAESHLPRDDREPAYTFSLIVPARHEQAVLEFTLERLIQSDHPAFELVVVVGDDDRATRDVAELVAARHPQLVKIVVDSSRPKSKPRALNTALPQCTGEITGVFDAEDVVHPALLQRVDQCFQQTDADIVQAGVQLMNFRSSWLTVHNVLEYYFWFRSRLHRHARQRFIPLGGNTVFIRTSVLRAVAGWDPGCLAEDCELGVRLSALGAHTAVFYEPELVTREECPPTLGAFVRQRTRWNQGYLQTLSRGYWRRLPFRQKALGGYILAMPFAMAIAWLLIPVAVGTAISLKAPVGITMMSFLPMLPMLVMLLADVVGLGEFGRAYGEHISMRDYARLVLALPLYQATLTYAAARAVARQARGASGWEKTAHLGLHLGQEVAAIGRGYLPQTGHALAYRMAGSGQPLAATGVAPGNLVHPGQAVQTTAFAERSTVPLPQDSHEPASLPTLPTDSSADPGHGGHTGPPRSSRLPGGEDDEPLWARLPSVPDNALASPPPPASSSPARIFALGSWRVRGRAILGRLNGSSADIAVLLVLTSALGAVQATNMLHWPAVMFDEGTYVGNAWAVGERGALAFYTYTYGHPPLAWLLITLWTSAKGIFGRAVYSLDGARELMCAVSIISFFLLFTLARRLGMGRALAALTVILFALSPLALFFHRGVLLDNPATMWVIAAFALAWSQRRRLWSFAGSGACFAASVLSKETTLVLLPALLLAAFKNADHRTRRYCLTLLVSFLSLIALAFPLYAALKGELIPGPGHVSLIGTDINMLFTRQGTGNVFDPHSVAHGTVTFWLGLDPWLVGVALVLSPIALVFRKTRAAAIAYLIQVLMVLRPGYLPAMYVIAMLPFAALVITGSIHQMWHLMISDRARPQIRQGWTGWRGLASWAAGLTRPVTAAASVVMITATATAVYVAPRWTSADIAAATERLDGPQLGAEHWLLRHAGHQQRLIVTDDFWVYLIEHGYDSHPEKGGFNSPAVVSYWPLDKDPAVRRFFPYSWREFNYIVANAAMRDTAIYTPSTAQALYHSRLAAVFGKGGQRIEIRAITPTPLRGGACAAGGTRTYRVPAAGHTPSLQHVAHALRVSADLIAACTNRYPENPAWWNYEANHKYNAPLPPSTVVHYRRE